MNDKLVESDFDVNVADLLEREFVSFTNELSQEMDVDLGTVDAWRRKGLISLHMPRTHSKFHGKSVGS